MQGQVFRLRAIGLKIFARGVSCHGVRRGSCSLSTELSGRAVTSAEIGRDSLAIGAGVSVIWNDRVSTYVYYDGEVARTNYQYNAVTGGVRITF